MNIDVRFTHGRQTIELKDIGLTADEAARIPVEHHQKLFEVLLWRTDNFGVIIALLPRFSKSAWRWSGRVRLNPRWVKLMPGDASSPGRWSCEVRSSPEESRKE